MVVKLDNVSRMLDSGVLASALVESVWQERLLGGNVMIDVPINCIWCCTANNPGMTTEIARRCVRIRIDPMRDKPWERGGFRHEDLRTFAEQTRGQMIWAALTMVRAWVTRGRKPFTGRVIGSYEEWTRTIGGILECAGIEGFLAKYVEFLEQADMEGQVWRAFVRQWWDRFRDKPVGVSELFELAGEDSELFSFGKISKQGMKSAMGRRLAKQRDRVVGDWRIMQCPTMRARAIQWMLMRVSETEEPEDEIEPVQVLGPEQPALLDDEENPFGEEDEEE
jgi:putative DNA primase/helicase